MQLQGWDADLKMRFNEDILTFQGRSVITFVRNQIFALFPCRRLFYTNVICLHYLLFDNSRHK